MKKALTSLQEAAGFVEDGALVTFGGATFSRAPMEFVRLPIISIVGALVYQEPIEIWVLIGGGVIMVGNLVNIYGRTRKDRSLSLPPSPPK